MISDDDFITSVFTIFPRDKEVESVNQINRWGSVIAYLIVDLNDKNCIKEFSSCLKRIFSYDAKVVDAFVGIVFKQHIFTMEVSVIYNVEAKTARVWFVNFQTFAQKLLLCYLELWNKSLESLPLIRRFNKTR